MRYFLLALISLNSMASHTQSASDDAKHDSVTMLLARYEYEKAEVLIKNMLSENKKDKILYYRYGLCLFGRKKFNDAAVQFEKALDNGFFKRQALYKKLQCYVALQDKTNSLRTLENLVLSGFAQIGTLKQDSSFVSFFTQLGMIDSIYLTLQANVKKNATWPAWSPDGKKILFACDKDGDYELYIIDADGSNMKKLTDNTAFDGMATFSRDGKHIVFSSNRDGQTNDLYIMESDGANQRRITNTNWNHNFAKLSSSGDKIVFNSSGIGDRELFICSLDGTIVQQLTDNNYHDDLGRWNLHDNEIIFDSDRLGIWWIFIIDPTTLHTRTVTLGSCPNFSRDGSAIIYQKGPSGEIDIYTSNTDGKNIKRLTTSTGDDYVPVLSPDGTKVAFTSHRDGNSEIYTMNVNGQNQKRITWSN